MISSNSHTWHANPSQHLLVVMAAVLLSASSCNWFNDPGVDVGSQDDVCAAYCEAMTDFCTDEYRQYATEAQCLAICDAMNVGEKGDEEGNSVYCRNGYSEEAEESPSGYCLSAGPGGDDVCGSNCDGFCQLQTEVCTGDHRQYATITECAEACEEIDDSEPYNIDVRDGDTLACRMAHLVLASGDPETNCPHIAPESENCR